MKKLQILTFFKTEVNPYVCNFLEIFVLGRIYQPFFIVLQRYAAPISIRLNKIF